jgi:hypothetical protein
MIAAAACSIALAVHVPAGARIEAHAVYDDRIAWVLPPDRLAAFAHSGVVIDEERVTTAVMRGTASAGAPGTTTVRGEIATTVVDVPRHRTQARESGFRTTVDARGDPMPPQPVDLESAGMIGLPARPLCVGQSWSARIAVLTSLGSGAVVARRTVVASRDGIVEIAVRADGSITGREENLPRLLPGTISMRGTAWFDMGRGVVRVESYEIDDRLVRTIKGRSIGFIETETVDASTVIVPR